MTHGMSSDVALDKVQGIVSRQLIPALHNLSARDGFQTEDRIAVLDVATALVRVPDVDPDVDIRMEVDLYWEDRNWIGTLEIARSALQLRSTMCQFEGVRPELCAQWQHTALDIQPDRLVHDPCHLWLWVDCFRRFVEGLISPSEAQRGSIALVSSSWHLDLNYGERQAATDSP